MCKIHKVQYACLHSIIQSFEPCTDDGAVSTRKCPQGKRPKSNWRASGDDCYSCQEDGRCDPLDTFKIMNLIQLRFEEERELEGAMKRATAQRKRAAAEKKKNKEMASKKAMDDYLSKVREDEEAHNETDKPVPKSSQSDDGTLDFEERPCNKRRQST